MDLTIDRLSKTYANGVHALQDVSLTIPPGMFGLLGPNGAGKSTLMRILATLQEADSGRVRLGEIDVLRDKESVRRTLGYLPQEFGLYPKVTAGEMLDHFALLKGVTDARTRRDTVRSLLEQTNLWEARDRRLGGFSGGMRQRFGIAVALIGNPRLIIVDEPTAGLDPAERVRFLNLLSELGERAVVILSTHIVEDVSDLCQRMAIINRGRILLEGEPNDAVHAIRGRVWRREVSRDALPAFEAAHPVISTTLVGGRTVVHVFGDAPPDDGFAPVQPDLKDVYFTVMRGFPLFRTDDGGSGPFEPAPIAILPVDPAAPVQPDDASVDPLESARPLAASVDAEDGADAQKGAGSVDSVDPVGLFEAADAPVSAVDPAAPILPAPLADSVSPRDPAFAVDPAPPADADDADDGGTGMDAEARRRAGEA